MCEGVKRVKSVNRRIGGQNINFAHPQAALRNQHGQEYLPILRGLGG